MDSSLQADTLRQRYQGNLSLLNEVRKRLLDETESALLNVDHVDRVAYRVKGVESFVEKATDPQNIPPYQDPLVEIEDQIAGRVVVFFLPDIDLVCSRLAGSFTAIESSRRRPSPDREFGYESHHLVCMIPPQCLPDGWNTRDDVPTTFELQIRTLFMHSWAEPQHDLGYKGTQNLPSEIKRELAWIAASAWGADQAYKRVIDRVRKLKSMSGDEEKAN